MSMPASHTEGSVEDHTLVTNCDRRQDLQPLAFVLDPTDCILGYSRQGSTPTSRSYAVGERGTYTAISWHRAAIGLAKLSVANSG